MGAGASTGSSDASPPTVADKSSTVHKSGRVRQSVMFNEDLLKGKNGHQSLVPSNVLEVQSNIFQIRVPPGVIPGGTFSAICQNRYVKVQVPQDAKTGDLIEIDLSGIVENTEGPPHAEAAQDPVTEATGPSVPPGLAMSVEQDEAKRLKKAAALFIKYGGQDEYTISLCQLEKMLEKEFQFPPGSDMIRKEMALADMDKDQTISFEEFVHWLTHLEMRLEVHRLQEQQKQLIAEAAQLKQQSTLAQVKEGDKEEEDDNDDDDDDDDGKKATAALKEAEEEEKRIMELQLEQERIRLQVEKQREEFQMEIEALKREKERLEEQKNKLAELQAEDAAKLVEYEERNDKKLRLMEEHHRANEMMIEKMKQDYLALNNRRKSEVSHRKEAARKKLEAKREAKKKGHEASKCGGCGGAKRACGCPKRVYHCEHCTASQKCADCGHN